MRRFVVRGWKVDKRDENGRCQVASSSKLKTLNNGVKSLREEIITRAHECFSDIISQSDEFGYDWIVLEEEVWMRDDEKWEDIETIVQFDCRTKQILPAYERPSAYLQS